MKMQLAILAIAALGVAYGDEVSLSSLWEEGAVTVGPPATEAFMNGDALRATVIQSYVKYLDILDAEMTRQYQMSTIETMISSATVIVDINSKLQLVWGGVAATNEFDYDLLSLTNIYNEIIELVRYGEGVVRSGKSIDIKKSLIPQLVEATDHQLADYFYHFHDEVLKNNFNQLEKWLMETLNAGEKNVLDKAGEMEKSSRNLYLWPMVKQVQADTQSIVQRDTEIQAYSTPNVWKQFATTRETFLALKLDF